MKCANGHEVPEAVAFCPACGHAVPEIASGWYDDPTDPGAMRYWDGTRWTQQAAPKDPGGGLGTEGHARLTVHGPTKSRRKRWPWIVGGGALAILLLALVTGMANSTHRPTTARAATATKHAAARSTPGAAMVDATATQAQVINSLKHDYCSEDGPFDATPIPVEGYTQVQCEPPSRSIEMLFYVYPTPRAMQLALDAGSMPCQRGEQVILGPTWGAMTTNPEDAAKLIDLGAQEGSCGSDAGNGTDNSNQESCPNGAPPAGINPDGTPLCL